MQPAFLVEGDQEKAIISGLCKNFTVRAFRTNGECVRLHKIVEVLNRQLKRNLYNRYYPIVILFDREKRSNSCEKIIEELKEGLKGYNYDVEQFVFGIVNRRMENWIIPFVDSNGEFTSFHSKEFEGEDCTGKLEQRLAIQNITYDKVSVGLHIFRQINPEILADASDSFRELYDGIKAKVDKDILNQCWWMNTKPNFKPNPIE